MLSLGWPYLWLCLAAYIVLLCFVSVSNWFVGELPARAVVIAFSAFTAYSLFLFFAVLGYAIFEYQNELGLTSAKPQLDAQRKQLYEKNRVLGEGLVFMRDGKLERARSALRRGLELFHDDLDLHFQYHALLMRLKDLDALCRHCDYVIALLTTRKLLGKGVEMVLDVQSRVPDFKLGDAHAAVEIARLMRKLGHHTAVIKLLMNLHEHRARDPIIPEAYLLVANTLFEPLKDDRAVLKIIEFINNEYPSCPQRPQFAKLKATLVGEKSFAVNE
jgi:tetratricopeptide (TPR) repeat protein